MIPDLRSSSGKSTTSEIGFYPGDFTRCCKQITFYRAMHFSAKGGIAIACRLSLWDVSLSVTLVNCDHIGWIIMIIIYKYNINI